MNPWIRIAQQSKWWVPQTGWEAWARSCDLETLDVGTQRLEVAHMPPLYKMHAGAFLVTRTLEVETLRSFLPIDAESSLYPPAVDRVKVLAAAATSPLALALCDQPSVVTPLLDHPLVQQLFEQSSAETNLVKCPAEFSFMNDALAGALVSIAAAYAPISLFSKLLRQRTPLQDALQLSTQLTH